MPGLLDPHAYHWNWHALPLMLTGTITFLVGLFIFIHNQRAPSNRFFFFLTLSINLWLWGNAFMYMANDGALAVWFYRWVSFAGVAFLSTSLFNFSVYWLGMGETAKRLGRWGLVGSVISYFVALGPWGFPTYRTYSWGYFPHYGPFTKAFIFPFLAYFLGAFYNYASRLKYESDLFKRKQIQWISVGFWISLIGALDYLPKVFYVNYYPIGFVPVLVWILMVAYAIIRYRAMDIHTVIHRTIMWAVTSLFFLFPVAALAYLGRDWLARLHPLIFSTVIVSVLLLFQSYARAVQPRVDHWFQRRRWNLAKALERFTDELVHLRSPEDLADHILRTLQSVLYVGEAYLCVRRADSGPFLCLRGIPKTPDRGLILEESVERWLISEDISVFKEYLEADPRYGKVREAIAAAFKPLDWQLVIPLAVQQTLPGLLVLGERSNLQPYRDAELNFLRDLRRSAAIALSNSLRSIAMQESLRRWNEELEQSVRERTRELRETQAKLLHAEKLATIGTLAGGVAHEINNPLTAVLTNAQLLKLSTSQAKDDLESVSIIEEGAKRCQAVVQKLMKYARRPSQEEAVGPLDLNRVVGTTRAFLEYQLAQENIEIDAQLAPVSQVQAAANELEQVLTNLLLNARDAIVAAKRKGKIIIRTFAQDGRIVLEVEDNGAGISEANVGKVFDPFFTTKDVGKGTGLGLSISYGIVTKHGGTIHVSSREGEGSCFRVSFPEAAS